MSRTTHFMGLYEGAQTFLAAQCLHNPTQECPCCGNLSGGDLLSSANDIPVEGMFGETVHILRTYYMTDDKPVEEYVQATPWSSGPCIFLALRDADTKKPIEETLWPQEMLDNC